MGQIKEFWVKRIEKRVVEYCMLYKIQAESKEEIERLLNTKEYGAEIITEEILTDQPYKNEDKIIQIQE